ncbi:MAG: Uma2 family endonuclease [Archangium sp.]|nr:Uma2 family endonuclease [Archangium sp.]
MGQAAKKRATYEDLLAYPEGTNVELIDGDLHVLPRPSTPHAMAGSALGGLVIPPFQFGRGGPGGWLILHEPELHLGGDALIPDLAGWRRERMPELPHVPAIELVPDWVCEFLSYPSTAKYDRTVKMPLYAEKGVKHLWIGDDQAHTLEVYRRTDAGWLLVKTFAGDELIRAEPFDAVEIDLSWLWKR